MSENYNILGVVGNCGAHAAGSAAPSTYGGKLSLAECISRIGITGKLIFLALGEDVIAQTPALSVLSGRHSVYCDGVLVVPPNNWPGKREWIRPQHGYRKTVSARPFYAATEFKEAFTYLASVVHRIYDDKTLRGLLTGLQLRENRVYHYSGAFITRPSPDSLRRNTGAYAARLRYLISKKFGTDANEPERWYDTGVDDIHVAFPVPLHRNPTYIYENTPHSGDSFSMMFYKGKNPPPILAGGVITVQRRLRRLLKNEAD